MDVRFNASHVKPFTHIKLSAPAWDLSEQIGTYLTNNTWWDPSQLESPARVPLAILFRLSHSLRGSMVSSIQDAVYLITIQRAGVGEVVAGKFLLTLTVRYLLI